MTTEEKVWQAVLDLLDRNVVGDDYAEDCPKDLLWALTEILDHIEDLAYEVERSVQEAK